MSATLYPLDFAALTKDSWIETTTLIEILGISPDNPMWGLRLAELCGQIEQQRQAGGDPLVARQDHNRIRLCSDPEADEYLQRRFEHGMRGMARSFRRRSYIDRDALDANERQRAESRDRYQSFTLQAMRAEERKQRMLQGLLIPKKIGCEED